MLRPMVPLTRLIATLGICTTAVMLAAQDRTPRAGCRDGEGRQPGDHADLA